MFVYVFIFVYWIFGFENGVYLGWKKMYYGNVFNIMIFWLSNLFVCDMLIYNCIVFKLIVNKKYSYW